MNPMADERRWKQLRHQYAEGWGEEPLLVPMVKLLDWIDTQEFASQLYAHTSMMSLCVTQKPGYQLDGPSFSCKVRHHDGMIEFTAWRKPGEAISNVTATPERICDTFAAFANRLMMSANQR